jgi:hypothetical protein
MLAHVAPAIATVDFADIRQIAGTFKDRAFDRLEQRQIAFRKQRRSKPAVDDARNADTHRVAGIEAYLSPRRLPYLFNLTRHAGADGARNWAIKEQDVGEHLPARTGLYGTQARLSRRSATRTL